MLCRLLKPNDSAALAPEQAPVQELAVVQEQAEFPVQKPAEVVVSVQAAVREPAPFHVRFQTQRNQQVSVRQKSHILRYYLYQPSVLFHVLQNLKKSHPRIHY